MYLLLLLFKSVITDSLLGPYLWPIFTLLKRPFKFVHVVAWPIKIKTGCRYLLLPCWAALVICFHRNGIFARLARYSMGSKGPCSHCSLNLIFMPKNNIVSFNDHIKLTWTNLGRKGQLWQTLCAILLVGWLCQNCCNSMQKILGPIHCLLYIWLWGLYMVRLHSQILDPCNFLTL